MILAECVEYHEPNSIVLLILLLFMIFVGGVCIYIANKVTK